MLNNNKDKNEIVDVGQEEAALDEEESFMDQSSDNDEADDSDVSAKDIKDKSNRSKKPQRNRPKQQHIEYSSSDHDEHSDDNSSDEDDHYGLSDSSSDDISNLSNDNIYNECNTVGSSRQDKDKADDDKMFGGHAEVINEEENIYTQGNSSKYSLQKQNNDENTSSHEIKLHCSNPRTPGGCKGLTNDKLWNMRFDQLSKYKEQHGNCLVPSQYAKNQKLANWVIEQRQNYRGKTLRKDRQERLDSIGFYWRGYKVEHEQRWEEMFERLQRYKQQHGDCIVRKISVTDELLCQWVQTQRRNYKLKTIRKDRQERLESIGFEWRVRHISRTKSDNELRWEEMFERLQGYKKKHGDFHVPFRCVEDKSLGLWVHNQRKKYRSKRLREDRRDRLESISFQWNVEGPKKISSKIKIIGDKKWEIMLERVQSYKKRHGTCNVPRKYDTKLRNWVQTQKQYYRLKILREDRQERLESIGFQWHKAKICSEQRRDELTNGNRQNNEICKDEKSFVGQEEALDKEEGIYAHGNQQKRNNGEEVPSHETEMPSSNPHIPGQSLSHTCEERWNMRFRQLQEYKEQYGDCFVPITYADNIELGSWLRLQRKTYKLKALRKDRQERLESIGFQWCAFSKRNYSHTCSRINKDKKWNEMFERLQRYKQQHGDCLVPRRYVDDRLLSRWVRDQRRNRSLNLLRKDKQERLESIGFQWCKSRKGIKAEAKELFEVMYKRLQTFKEEQEESFVPKSIDL